MRSPRRVIALLAFVIALLGLSSGPVSASGHVIVAVSPTTVPLGQPIEVLVRTFEVLDARQLALPLPTPQAPYPVASGLWDVLYPWPDYPFDVVAAEESATGTDSPVTVAVKRDPGDATLWRASVVLSEAGRWIVRVRNFEPTDPGASAHVTVAEAASPSRPASSGEAIAVALALALGLLAVVLWRGRAWPRHGASD